MRMSKVEEMESELRKLSQLELRQIRVRLDDLIEDDLEFTQSLNGLSSNPNARWPTEELHVCASRRSRERSHSDLLHKV